MAEEAEGENAGTVGPHSCHLVSGQVMTGTSRKSRVPPSSDRGTEAGSLNPSTVGIWGPGLYPLEAGHILSSGRMTKMFPDIAKCPKETKSPPGDRHRSGGIFVPVAVGVKKVIWRQQEQEYRMWKTQAARAASPSVAMAASPSVQNSTVSSSRSVLGDPLSVLEASSDKAAVNCLPVCV